MPKDLIMLPRVKDERQKNDITYKQSVSSVKMNIFSQFPYSSNLFKYSLKKKKKKPGRITRKNYIQKEQVQQIEYRKYCHKVIRWSMS